VTDETAEQILARYRELWRDPFLTMSAALDLDNTRRRLANLGALKREKESAENADKLERIRRTIFPKD
jgi:hypothetical protein